MAPGSMTDAAARRVLARCDALAACTVEPGRITRPFPSPAMSAAQDMVRGWMEAAGLSVRIDPVGNLIGRLASEGGDSPDGGNVLLLGSHLDSVRDAGRYDGVLGVLAGLAVVEELSADQLPFHVDVVALCDEEGLRFGSTYFGSLALTGSFPDELLAVPDRDGITLAEALAAAGYAPDRIERAAYDPERTLGYLELHIEQGPRLDDLGRSLGIATAIAGQTKMSFRFDGRAAHAGTTPMELRRDALAGAAEWVVAVEGRALRTPGLVATVGSLRADPGALNVVAGSATCTLDLRHEHDAERIAAVADLQETARELSRRRGLELHADTLVDDASTPLDPGFAERLERLTGAPTMVSGAGHDASVMSAFTPSALLFVRSPGGVSHHPNETVSEADVAEGLRSMIGFVRDLAREHA